MFLKSISIRGFKSFADKTELTFTPGVVAIVGPNGSGKSNVSDAVLWALGEQSARHLRGSSMEDVIFAGSRDRPALGLAEVLLTLDNSTGAIPIEYTELTIGRRLYRSGESEYLLAGRSCRLADIHELLSAAGLGRGVYSVISQGRIDEVLSSRPEERRSLIDEAAGVAGHRRKRERALRKLDRVEQDLVRINDIHSEVKRRLGPLRRQAEAARSGRGLHDRLRMLQVRLAVDDLRQLQASWEEVTAAQTRLTAERQRITQALSEASAAEEKAGRQVTESSSQLSTAEGQAAAFRRADERMDALVRQAAIHLSHLTERAAADGSLTSSARLTELNAKLSAAEEQAANIGVDSEASKALFEERRRLLDDARAARLALREEQAKLEKELEQVASRLQSLDRDESRVNAEIEAAASRLQSATLKLASEADLLGELDSALSTMGTEALLDCRKAVEEAVHEHKQAEEAYRSLNGSVAEARMEESRAREAAAAVRAEETTLAELMAADTGDGVIRGLSDHDGVWGSVADLISYPAQHERAFEAVLGETAKAFVVNSSETVLGIIDAAEGTGGRTYFQVADLFGSSIDTPPLKGAVPLASLIEAATPDAPDLRPLLTGCYLVDDLKVALGASAVHTACTFVTPHGEVAGPGPLLLAGGESGTEAGALRLRRLCREASEKKSALEDEAIKAAFTRSTVEERLSSATTLLREAEAAVTAAQQKEANLLAEARALEERVVSAKSRQEEAVAALASEEERVQAVQLRLSAIAEDRERLGPAQTAAAESLEAATQRLLALAQAESAAELELEKAREAHSLTRSGQERASALAEHIRSDIESVIAASEKEAEGASARARAESELPLLIRALSDLRTAARSGLANVGKELEELLTRSGDIRSAHAMAQESLRRLRMEDSARGEELHRVELRRAAMQGKVEAAVKHLTEDLDTPLDVALREPELDIPREDARSEVARLRTQVNRMGPINPMAIEECDELEERNRFYEQQLSDLSESKKAIMDGVAELDEHIKSLFASTFESAADHFTEIFSSLFPGSRGRLLLTDGSDLLGTGVDIEVRIAGKRPQKLSLLSGGERALSALAFNFALYATRPTPFCILDEADAALDDYNISRYLELIERFRGSSQFFIVTHQKRTMNHADLIYGVSMQRSGVSAVVSQRAASLDNPHSKRSRPADAHQASGDSDSASETISTPATASSSASSAPIVIETVDDGETGALSEGDVVKVEQE